MSKISNTECSNTSPRERFQQSRKCLELIRDIAHRGAESADPETVGYALQELTQTLFERTGSEDRCFEPIPATEIEDLPHVLEELELVSCCIQDLANRRGESIH